MLCKNCGNLLADDAVFCNACGASTAPDPVPSAPQQPVYTPTVEDPGKTYGTAAFVLGIVSLCVGTVCSCLMAFLGGILPLIAAIVGVVMGKMGMNKSAAAGFENKKAKNGMIMSIVAIAVIVVFIILNAILGAILGSVIEEILYELY